MKKLSIFFFIIFISSDAFSQQAITFSSSKLQEMSLRYSGNILNWPILVSLADHDIGSNTFELSAGDLLQLRRLSNTSLIFEKQQERVNKLIGEGATIFAKNELQEVTQLFKDYLFQVQNGQLENSLQLGELMKPYTDALERTLMRNRLTSVQAQLTAKDGFVDKRIGLLAEWNSAILGDFFEESHGVRTKEESYATLSFTDGSKIVVNPNTTAVIRKSRIDQLDKSADAEITLVSGGLLSKLSAAGKERSKYILNAGSSTTELNTQSFYAENSDNNIVKLSNYDGDAEVTANNVIVKIKKDEGTIVRGNQAPLTPVKLLAAPKYLASKTDTILYQQDYILAFRSVPKAVKYRVEYSTSHSFDENVIVKEITNTRILIENLELGTTFIRIQSVDELGLKGPYSEPMFVIRNEDTKAPPIFGDQFNRPIYFTDSRTLTVTGITEPDAVVTVMSKPAKVSRSGEFSAQISLSSNDETIIVTSTDDSQNQTLKELRIVRLTENYLFDIKINGASANSDISSINSLKTITGTAFPEMEVEIKNEGTTKIVKTDSKGRWGITMDVQQGKLSITFRTNQKSTTTLTKSLTVK
ncbi:MAG: FecR domain-containing protein [Balneola sp.]